MMERSSLHQPTRLMTVLVLSGLTLLAIACANPLDGNGKGDGTTAPAPTGSTTPTTVPPTTPATVMPSTTPAPGATPFPVPSAPAGFVYYHDVVVGTGGLRQIKIEICAPASNPGKKLPVIAGIHGGGWNKGSKDDYRNKIVDYAEKGFVGVSIDYRLTSETGNPVFPAQLEDCKLAIRYLKANASLYYLDPDNIAVWGSSAGSHLAALLGTTADQPQFEGSGGWAGYSSKVKCVVDFFGPADFTTQWANDYGSVTSLLGVAAFNDAAKATAAMPGSYASANDSPFLILHGTADTVVPIAQSTVLRDQLLTGGVDVTYGPVQDAGHGFSDTVYDWTTALAYSFIDYHLKGSGSKPTNPPANPTPTPTPTALPARAISATIPIGNWRFNEPTGAYECADATTYAPGVRLVAKGSGYVTGETGRVGKALRFTDAKTFLINDDPETKLHVADLSQTSSLSLEAWVKFDELPSTYAYKADGSRTDVKIIYKVGSATTNGVKVNSGYELMVSYADNAPLFKLWNTPGSSSVKSSVALTETGRWYHLVATYDGAEMKIYVDGVLGGTTAKTAACGTAVAPSLFRIGGTSNSDSNGVKGCVDEVRVYNAPMNASEVAARFAAP